MMAAAASPGSRGVAGVSTTKTLILILSLLSLVHVATSLIDTDHLEIVQEYFEKGINEAARKKAVYDYVCTGASIIFVAKLEELDPTLKKLKAAVEKFPPLQGLTTVINTFMKEEIEEFSSEIQARRKELKDIWDFIKLMESNRDDDDHDDDDHDDDDHDDDDHDDDDHDDDDHDDDDHDDEDHDDDDHDDDDHDDDVHVDDVHADDQ